MISVRRSLCLALVLMLASANGRCQLPWSHRPKAPASFGKNPVFDARYVHDLYALSRCLLSSPLTLRLVLCTVSPDHQSGVFSGYAEFDPKTRTYVDTGVEGPAYDFGVYRVVGGLGCTSPNMTGTFRWLSPEVRQSDIVYMWYTDPFSDGGLAAIVAPKKDGLLEPPQPTYAVHPSHVDMIRDEITFVESRPLSFWSPEGSTGLASLQVTLGSANPLVAMEAARALSADGKLSDDQARGLATNPSEIRQALAVVAILCTLTRERERTTGRVILSAVDEAKTAEQLKGLLIGAVVAHNNLARQERARRLQGRQGGERWTPPPLEGEAVFANSVVLRILRRHHDIGLQNPADKYLNWFSPWHSGAG